MSGTVRGAGDCQRGSAGCCAGHAERGRRRAADVATGGSPAIGCGNSRIAWRRWRNRWPIVNRSRRRVSPRRCPRLVSGQLRRRVEDTLTLLRHARFDQAGYEQQQVLDDLVAVLELLKRDGSDLAELRAERKRLEAARENVQALHDAQRQAMSDAAARVPFDSPDDYDRAAAEQHDVERQTRDLHEQMREESASERACPGQKEVGPAGECMQQAGEKYEEKQQDAAARAAAGAG